MNNVNANIIVKGLVQGVGFRYYTHRHATNLGLTGYVRNLFTGEVEIGVEGERSLVEEMISLIKVGPSSSRVTDVKIDWRTYTGMYHTFNISF